MPGEKKEFEEEVAKEIIKAAEEEYGKAQGEAVSLVEQIPSSSY